MTDRTRRSDRVRPVLGCILAGGRSSRMGGGDKGLRPLAGRPMMARAVERLGAETDHLILNANGDPDRFAEFGLPVIPDSIHGFAGPLAGVLAALDFAAARHPDAVFVATAAADTPFFPEGLVETFLDAAETDDTIVIAETDEGRHPVFGLWPVGLRADLRAFLDGGERKVGAFIDRHRHAVVRIPPLLVNGRLVDPFFNVNTPSELVEAEEIAEALQGAAADQPLQPPPASAGRRRDRPAPGQPSAASAVRPVRPFVIGVAGWKNAGKTTLVVGLVTAFVARGLSVATVKHAHHGFDVDHPGTDSHRHRQAGAVQTALVSARRVALMKELASPDEEPLLADVLAALDPADVVVVEGWKREPIPKVEVRRREAARHDPLHPADPAVVAIAADHPVEASVPTFSLDEIDRLADYLLTLRP